MSFMNGTAADHLQENLKYFIPVKLLLKFSIHAPRSYVLKSSISSVNPMQSRFAVALSNNIVKIFDIHGSPLDEYAHDNSISHIKFSTSNPDILFTSSLDGKIQVWDQRSKLSVQTFLDDSDVSLKPILCFDYNHNEEIICGGTELIREDAFHLFWDRRSSKVLGAYWNSHAGDITQIHFYPEHTSWMASSSVDGLINVFDLKETSEDDALMQTVNIEAPVNTFSCKSEDILSCTTAIEEYHLIKVDSAHSMFSTSREKLFKDYQVRVDCMIDSLPIMDKLFLVTGKNSGQVQLWDINESIQSADKYNGARFLLKGHNDAVRTVSYNENADVLLTGGDDGNVCLWRLKSEIETLRRS